MCSFIVFTILSLYSTLVLASCQQHGAFCTQHNQRSPHESDLSFSQRRICVIDDLFEEEARSISSSLSLPILSDDSNSLDFTHGLRLVPFKSGDVSTYALAIESLLESRKQSKGMKRPNQKNKSNSFYVDLCPEKGSRMGKRGAKESGADLLVKAVTPGKGYSSTTESDGGGGAIIYDLTAGFGQDSLVLALNGASKVYMVERDPIVAALLGDALRRVRIIASNAEESDQRKDFAMKLSKILELKIEDGKDFVKSRMEFASTGVLAADVVYLDPMFPPRTKSAAVKKGMSILHGLLETQKIDPDSTNARLLEENKLLESALEAAGVRVVVKRPSRAPPLGGESSTRPSYSIKGSSNRWDVYVCHHQAQSNSY